MLMHYRQVSRILNPHSLLVWSICGCVVQRIVAPKARLSVHITGAFAAQYIDQETLARDCKRSALMTSVADWPSIRRAPLGSPQGPGCRRSLGGAFWL